MATEKKTGRERKSHKGRAKLRLPLSQNKAKFKATPQFAPILRLYTQFQLSNASSLQRKQRKGINPSGVPHQEMVLVLQIRTWNQEPHASCPDIPTQALGKVYTFSVDSSVDTLSFFPTY